jgi:hypothetical protein
MVERFFTFVEVLLSSFTSANHQKLLDANFIKEMRLSCFLRKKQIKLMSYFNWLNMMSYKGNVTWREDVFFFFFFFWFKAKDEKR